MLGVGALALPTAASAVQGDHPTGKPDKPGKGVSYVFKGTYAGESAVAVTKGNKHARDFEGETVTFDLSAAKVSVADTTGDGVVNVDDVVVGDSVVVKAKLPKGTETAQPIVAKHLVDQTNPAAEEPVSPTP